MHCLKMNNGLEIPVLGLGTYEMKKEDVKHSIQSAMEIGYRLYDTAQVYGNEKEVGEAISSLTLAKREEVFITTKVSTYNQGYEKAKESVKESLEVMGLSYLDLVLIHWPGVRGKDPHSPENKVLRHETYKALLDLQKEGLVKSVGVSNFMKSHLEALALEFKAVPQVNQIEISPLCHPKETIRYCKDNNIVVQAYSSLGRGLLFDKGLEEEVPVFKKLKTNPNFSTLMLRWAVQNGFCVIPKSIHKERILENSKVFDVRLSEEDMEELNNIEKDKRTCWDPNTIL